MSMVDAAYLIRAKRLARGRTISVARHRRTRSDMRTTKGRPVYHHDGTYLRVWLARRCHHFLQLYCWPNRSFGCLRKACFAFFLLLRNTTHTAKNLEHSLHLLDSCASSRAVFSSVNTAVRYSYVPLIANLYLQCFAVRRPLGWGTKVASKSLRIRNPLHVWYPSCKPLQSLLLWVCDTRTCDAEFVDRPFRHARAPRPLHAQAP